MTRSEQYFLPQLELEDEELAALQTALYLLEGKLAYAEPLRLALQNLALGAAASRNRRPTPRFVEVVDQDYTPEMSVGSASCRARSRSSAQPGTPYWSISVTTTPSEA